MDTLSAFAIEEANREKELMVFDWNKAAQLIKEHKPQIACAGLCTDWEWTGVTIYENGKPEVEGDTYLASTWETPEIEIDGEIMDCYLMESETDKWNSGTVWPQSALDILNKED